MGKWNRIIDVALCQICSNCVLAAKDELVGNQFPKYSAPHPPHGTGVFRIERCARGGGHLVGAAYASVTCNHCDDAPCVKAGAGAIKNRPDGIAIIDSERARGRRDRWPYAFRRHYFERGGTAAARLVQVRCGFWSGVCNMAAAAVIP